MTQVHADPVRGEPERDSLDTYGATGLAEGGGEEERGLVGHVLESVDVQRFLASSGTSLYGAPSTPSSYQVRVRVWSTCGGALRCGGSGRSMRLRRTA